MTTEQIHKMCNLQHKITICELFIHQMPLGYTQDMLGEFQRDMEIRAKYDTYRNEQDAMIKEIGMEVVGSTFSNKELMKLPENRFTFEEQKEATFEVIGRRLTFEEVFEKYFID